MNWRAPWLKDRSLPLLLVNVDVVMISGVYSGVTQARAGLWSLPGNGVIYTTCAWIFLSYILGRYTNKRTGSLKTLAWDSTLQSFVASSVICVSLVVHSWAYQVVDAQTRFRGFLIPALAIIGILSIGTRLCMLSIGKESNTTKWILFCTDREKQVLISQLRDWERAKMEFRSVDEYRMNRLGHKQVNIAVSSDLDPKEIDYFYLANLRANGCRVVGLREWCEATLQRIPSELVDEQWFLLSEGFAVQPGRIWWRAKRVGDVLFALTLAVVSLPIVIAAGMAIWVADKGPIFYSQERTGIYGSRIKIWKLRSMRVNAENNGAKWATMDDERVTRVGRIIRKTRIDELPQLWSVVAGDLSLVGPRPERPVIEEELVKHIGNYRTREWIRPGLSGWAQVCYPYGASIEDTRMKLSYDLYYLKNAGLLMDALILLKTIRLVIRAEGSKPTK